MQTKIDQLSQVLDGSFVLENSEDQTERAA